jgi:large subunit ribosomal protein L9
MKLVLQHDVEDLGFAGEVVKVKPGYARNFLLPKKYAVLATPNNLRRVEKLKKETEKRHDELRSSAESLAVRLKDIEVVLKRKVGEENKLYGSVTSQDIAEGLEAQGFEISRKKIHMGEPIKLVGEYAINVKLFKDVFVDLKVKVEPENATKE